ncbi:MAG: hypothetical protein ACTSU7_00990 [Candidatus Heimdallarchaeaceae archaeon]
MDFPKQNIPESEKTKDWYEKCVLALYRGSKDNERFRSERIKEYENYDFYNGRFSAKQYEYVTSTNGITNPARLVNFPLIQPKLDLMAGELISTDLVFSTNVTNRNAIRKKTEDKINAATQALLTPIRRDLEKMLGTELTPEEEEQMIPPDIQELQSTPYRTNLEKQIHAGIKYLIRRYDLKQVFKNGFYDLGIAGKEFYRNIVENNVPRSIKVDSRSMIYDIDTDTEFLHQAAYAGQENYFTIHEVLDKYRDKIYQNYPKKEADEMILELEKLTRLNSTQEQRGAFEGWNSNYYLESQNGTLKLAEVHLQWRGLKKFRFKVSPNKHDPENPYYKVVKDSYKPRKGEKIIVKPMTWIYEGVMIGGRYLITWGEKEDQVRYEDNYFDTKLDYFGCIRNNFNGRTLSIVDSLKNIQILYNIVHHHIELALARSGGKSIIYDVSQKPKNMPLDEVLYHAKNSGLTFINSQQEGIGSGFNQFQAVDMTLSQSVSQLVNLKMVLEDTADKLTGISAARSGITKSGDLVGVTERNVMQSSLLTAPYFEIHYKVVGDVLQDLADKLRLCVRKSKDDFYVDVYGDNGIEIMKIDRDLSYDQIGINLENSAKEVQRKQQMMQFVDRFTNSGEIDPITVIKAVNSESSAEIEQIITRGVESVRALSLQEQERANAIQEQTNQIAAQKLEHERYKIDANNASDEKQNTETNQTKLKIAAMNREKEEDLEVGRRNTELDKEALRASNEQIQKQEDFVREQNNSENTNEL